MINLNQLRIFYYAAKNMSFTNAAKELHISQPAVTSQVRQFEEACNLVLFKRKWRKVFLTDEGKVLYDYATKLFKQEEQIENVIDDMKRLNLGVLRLGTTKTYARYFMPYMMTAFHASYPKVKIHLNEGSSLEMINSLLHLENEVAVIAKAEDNSDVSFTPFSQEELVVIMAPQHHFAKRQTISFEEIAREPVIMKEIGSGTRRAVNELFERFGVEPDILAETSNTEFIKQLVMRGEGFSFLVKEAVALELKEKKLVAVDLEEGKSYLDISIAYLKKQQLSRPAQAFLDILGRITPENILKMGIGALTAEFLKRRR